MKQLAVPYIEGLEGMDRHELGSVLDKRGAEGLIDNAPWTEFPYKPTVSFRIAASDTHLFVRYTVDGLGLKAEFSRTNEPVWQDSCLEAFFASPDGLTYRNFEVNCIGTLLSSRQKAKGVDVEPISLEDAEKVIRIPSMEQTPFAEKDGEHRWTMTVGIPFALLGYEARPERLRANFYKCADGSRWPHYLCWSEIATAAPDFHRPEFFGELVLEKLRGN